MKGLCSISRRDSSKDTSPSSMILLFLLVALFFLPCAAILPTHTPGGVNNASHPYAGSIGNLDDLLHQRTFSVVDGFERCPGFGGDLASIGDVNGDGCDDLLVGTADCFDRYWRNGSASETAPFPNLFRDDQANYLLLGRSDREFELANASMVEGLSSAFKATNRWVGDINGDGLSDIAGIPNWDGSSEHWVPDRETGAVEPCYMIDVRYGTDRGLPERPDVVIDLEKPASTLGDGPSFDFGGVGDVNGDGYDDILCLLSQDPPLGQLQKVIVELFYGSSEGIRPESAWTTTLDIEPLVEGIYYRYDEFWEGSIHHADVNGDGFQDVLILKTLPPHVLIFHGSAQGLPKEPNYSMSGTEPYRGVNDTHWDIGTLITPIRFNDDAYDDVAWCQRLYDDSPEPPYPIPPETYVDDYQVAIFEGTEDGLCTEPILTLRFTHLAFSDFRQRTAAFCDIDGDSIDDLVVCMYLDSIEGGPRLNIEIHFCGGGVIAPMGSWNRTVPSVVSNPNAPLGFPVRGDFDGDGIHDLAFPAPERQVIERLFCLNRDVVVTHHQGGGRRVAFPFDHFFVHFGQ